MIVIACSCIVHALVGTAALVGLACAVGFTWDWIDRRRP